MTQAIINADSSAVQTVSFPICPSVSLFENRPCVSSVAVAEHFGKRHGDVLNSIRKIASECPSNLNERNFSSVKYIDAKGEEREAYNLYRDGFMLVVMSYTGTKAMQIKIAYITRFNEMEAALLSGTHGEPVSIPSRLSLPSDPERKELTALINAWVGCAPIHYAGARAVVNAHFGVKSINEMTAEQVRQALAFVQQKIDETPKALPESNVTIPEGAMDYLISKKLEEIVDGKISLENARKVITAFIKAGQITPAKGQPPIVLMEDQMEERFLELKEAAKEVKLKTNRFMHGVYTRILLTPDDKRNIASRMFVTMDRQWQSINLAIDAMEEHAKSMCALNRVL